MIFTGILMFLKPVPSSEDGYWVYFYITYVVYSLLGTAFYYLFNNNIVSLTSRNIVDREKVAYARKLSWTLISGTLIGMVINSVLLPYVIQPDETLNSFWMLICGMTVLAIPLLLTEYFYTRERVVEDVQETTGNANDVPVREQFKALFHDKCYVLLLITATIGSLADNFRGTNVQYYFVSYVLDGIHDPSLFMMYTILTGVPLGIGAFVVYPVTKRFGIQNTTLAGYSIVAFASLLGLIFPTSVSVAYIAGFLKQVGYIPAAYMLGALTVSCFDSVEHSSGYRLEGLIAVGVVGTLQQVLYAPVAGLYEKILTMVGFDANSTGFQPAVALTVLGIAFYGIEFVCAGVNVCVLPFIDLEKRLPRINADLLERKRQAVLARGEEWVDPEELERREREKLEKEAEENRVRDLKERCARKGLDFQAENDRKAVVDGPHAWESVPAKGGALMLSVARIPVAGFHFQGVIGVVLLDGREHRLATYLGAKAAGIRKGRVRIVQGSMELEAELLEGAGKPLRAPAKGDMVRTIHENAACRAKYRFWQNGRTLLDFETDRASFEYEYLHPTMPV